MTEENQEQVDRKDLKIEALKQELAAKVDQVAELRADLTIYDSEYKKLLEKVNELEGQLSEQTEDPAKNED